MDIVISGFNGESAGTINVSSSAFNRDFNEDLIHQAVVAYAAGSRQGSKAQKNRSDVRGGGKKPWKQKGSGRARAGSSRSPIWRHGGVTFAARPRSFGQKINKKMYKAAISSIVSELIRQDRLIVVESFNIGQPKTKELLEKIRPFNAENLLIISEEISENMYLSARNVPSVDISDINGADPVRLVGFDKILMTVSAIKKLEERLA